MATKNFYGKPKEIETAEQLLVEIDAINYPEKDTQMGKVVKGLKLLKEDVSQKKA